MSNTEIIKYNYLRKNPIEESMEATGMTRMQCLNYINNSKWSHFRQLYSQRIPMHEVIQKSGLTIQECKVFIKNYNLLKIEQRNKKLLKPKTIKIRSKTNPSFAVKIKFKKPKAKNKPSKTTRVPSIRTKNKPSKPVRVPNIRTRYSPSKEQKLKYSTRNKVKNFQKRGIVTEPYDYLDVIKCLKNNPYCYISQEKIDIYDTRSWSLDHFIPVSKGGDSNLNNLKFCKTKYNYMKHAMLFDEFVDACKKIAAIHG